MSFEKAPVSPFETAEARDKRQAGEMQAQAMADELAKPAAFAPFTATKNNVCILLRDAWRILEDGPDNSDKARAEAKLGEAMALARIVCKELAL